MKVHIECELKKILKQKGCTQQSLATKAGIRPSTVSDLCNKKIDRIYMSTLEKICEVLDIGLNDLLVIREIENTLTC
jgi:putative transcriptional regulator